MKTFLYFLFFNVLFSTSALAIKQTEIIHKDTLFFYFEKGSSEYIQKETTVKNLELLRSNEFDSISFYACADSTGPTKFNEILAQNRLENVKTRTVFNAGKTTFTVLGESNQFSSLEKNRCVYLIISRKIEEKIQVIHPIVKRDTLLLHFSFVPGESTLLSSSAPILKDLFLMLDTISYSQIQLHGHVCCAPDKMLSYYRAKAVEKELILHGIDLQKIKCFGHSNEEPKVVENSAKNKQINRRVELIILP